MGRKSRLKRERAEAESPLPAVVEVDTTPADDVIVPARERAVGSKQRPAKRAPVGARVARVAVDEDTWAAFRALCGSTPASVRLGQLVTAEVRRSGTSWEEPHALAALEEIRARTDELEALIRGVHVQS